MSQGFAAIERFGLVPLIVIDDARSAGGVADALAEGGLPVAEVTLRTPQGLAALTAMSARANMLVGAGSVTTTDQAMQARDAGAAFIVCPGFHRELVEKCIEWRLPCVPGTATASEIMGAVSVGVTTVKFFPASMMGGPAGIEALSAPFPGLSFIPTGGVTSQNMGSYLALSSVVAVGGSWIASRRAIAQREFEPIRERAAEAVKAVEAARRTR